ncbi:MAG: M23 family metallopeptidase [Acidobacteriota bacterium]|nr:M23 family metallopeptidase [Acidobacteriota bacterium]OQB52358.1 MAG: Murein DD-endopeptidase MepM [Candidatus Aminicenantes bacterium ADurb.Bin147]HNQ80443.1 M23 family metallopeptidase [Candidatus Aminicenantes bacterium]MDD8009597.1 M23 family metallopeptidase [Acidobacteriota bacterium]MDD8028432.1 M23 family metallopeptidase [Acidobacteriota bacterium]
MGKKHLSLIVIPHTTKSPRTWSFSRRTVKAATVCGIGLAVLMTAVTVDYVRVRLSRRSYHSLVAENAKQKEELRVYGTKVGELERKLNGFREYAGKLNVFAGIKSPEMLTNPGVGGGQSAFPPDAAQVIPPPGNPPPSIASVQDLTRTADDLEKNLDALLSHFEQLQGQFATRPSIAPVIGYRSSGFGWRLDPFGSGRRAFHSGLDIATVHGNPVVATADGAVLRVAYDGALGNNIIINHGNGITTLYGHLSKALIKPGARVKRGDTIGLVGRTGRALGDHVHYEVRLNGSAVNPNLYILDEF